MTWGVCSDPALGYDLAHWQGRVIPWADAKALGIRWAVAKTWHGRGEVASQLEQLEGARVATIEIVGRYGWMLPDADLNAQVAAWTSMVRARDELPLAIDFEEPCTAARGQSLIARLEHCIEAVSDRIGQRPIIYTGAWYWTGYALNLDSQIVAECPLWLAAYPRKAASGTRYQEAVAEVCGGVMPSVPRPWKDRGIEPIAWQFDGDKGLLLANGVDVDVNTAAWSRLRALAGRDTLPAPPDSDAPTQPGTPTSKSSQRLRALSDVPIYDGPATPLRAPEAEHTVRLEDIDPKELEGIT